MSNQFFMQFPWIVMNNQLTALPETIGQLSQLQKLLVGWNRLNTLPQSIGQLTQLQDLHAANNRLTALPETIGQLSQLKMLNLYDNLLRVLPEEFGQLSQLQFLMMNSNRLTALPETIGQLSQLQRLHVEKNLLTSLPVAIGGLSRLNELCVDRNQLTVLPETIGQLSQLQKLSVKYNQLNTLPESLGQLSQLQELDVGYNQLHTLPGCIGHLINLQELQAESCQLTTIPDWIGQLNKLQKLSININLLTFLPERIGDLINLQQLYVGRNRLNSLPEGISNLIGLEVLNMGCNRLTSLPEGIGALINLKELRWEGNGLTALPEAIGQLSQLRQLWVNVNQLTVLPNSLFQLRQGCTVYLEGNRFSSGAIERIQATTNVENYAGPRLLLSIHEERSSEDRALLQLLQELCQHAEKEPIQLNHLANNEHLKIWLSRLADVGDYQNQSRKKIASMIYEAIRKAETDEAFREVFLNCIQGAAETCGDRVALSILYLGLNLQIQKSVDENDFKTLAYLLWHGTYTLSQLEIYAQLKERTLMGVDPIEVYLAYPIKLKEFLEIPIINESMLYFRCSGVTEEDWRKAGNEVKIPLSNKDLFFEFLVKNKTWEGLLKAHPETTEAFKQIEENRLNAQNLEDEEAEVDYEQIEKDYDNELINLTKRVLAGNMPPFLIEN